MSSFEDVDGSAGQTRRERGRAGAGGQDAAGCLSPGASGRRKSAQEEHFGLQRSEGSQSVVQVAGAVDLHLQMQSIPNHLNQ